MSIISRTEPLTRRPIPDLSKVSLVSDASKISMMVRSLQGDDDLALVRNSMIHRYAQVIVPVKDEVSGATSDSLYRANSRLKVDYAAKEAILAGQQEIIRLYLYNSIVRQRATLFSEPTLRYEYTSETTGDIMGEIREEGAANLSAQRWDALADGIGSCAVYISDAGGVLSYKEIAPNKLWFAHAETILDGGYERRTNADSLDEASVVCIELAPTPEERRFATWFGGCEAWPDGRHCIYCGEHWYDVPDLGNAKALEYSASARGFVAGATDPANPLELIAKDQGAKGAPVYPIAILYSDAMMSGLMPVTTGLYDVCAEIDLMGSMTLGAAGRGARGAKALQRGTDTSVPAAVDEGLVLLGREQELTNVGWPASHSKDAMDVISATCRWIAESFGVPGWLVANDQAGEVPSGVALQIMTLPLQRNRNARIELNRSGVARRFAIERLVVNGAMGSPAISYDERETWHAGERKWPVDPTVAMASWQQRISMGEADIADVVQDLRSLKTREEALNWLETRKGEQEEWGEVLGTKKEEAAPVPPVKLSLAERLSAAREQKGETNGQGSGKGVG
jgi:hypothetical protein